MFYQIFLSPQVKQFAIISYDPRKLANIKKVSKPHRMIAQGPLPTSKLKPC